VVRTEFSRLRQRLKDYYAEDGRRDTIVIEFPPRSYVASFTFRDASKLREPTAFPEPRTPLSATGAAECAAGAAALAYRGHRRDLRRRSAQQSCCGDHHASLAAAKQPIKEPIQAIVVLPFENYSPNHQDDYIADGITEELTNDLAQWRDMRVVARTSAFAFKGKGEDIRQIGQQLNVDTVLEGSFTR
jgi:TolB-like protein